MTATTLEPSTQLQDENSNPDDEQHGSENAPPIQDDNANPDDAQHRGENAPPTAKQTPSGKARTGSVRFLSEFINEVPDTRRIKFIVNLKEAIRRGQFDGTPIAETFTLTYTGRGSEGPEDRETVQRDFAVENSSAFKVWLAQEAQPISTRPKYPSRQQFEGGQVSLAELAAKFRGRGSTSKSKARR